MDLRTRVELTKAIAALGTGKILGTRIDIRDMGVGYPTDKIAAEEMGHALGHEITRHMVDYWREDIRAIRQSMRLCTTYSLDVAVVPAEAWSTVCRFVREFMADNSDYGEVFEIALDASVTPEPE